MIVIGNMLHTNNRADVLNMTNLVDHCDKGLVMIMISNMLHTNNRSDVFNVMNLFDLDN